MATFPICSHLGIAIRKAEAEQGDMVCTWSPMSTETCAIAVVVVVVVVWPVYCIT